MLEISRVAVSRAHIPNAKMSIAGVRVMLSSRRNKGLSSILYQSYSFTPVLLTIYLDVYIIGYFPDSIMNYRGTNTNYVFKLNT